MMCRGDYYRPILATVRGYSQPTSCTARHPGEDLQTMTDPAGHSLNDHIGAENAMS
jgi:hypothetical protein